MSRKITLKTLVSLLAMSFIALPVFAQQARPPESDLPPLRTQLKDQNQIRPNQNVAPARKANPTGVDASELPMRGAVGAPKTCKPQTGQIVWNWENVALSGLVATVSRVTCKSFILADASLANKKITILSNTKVTVEQAWQSFLSALESNGMTTVKTGAFYKILGSTTTGMGQGAASSFQKSNTPIYQKGETVPADESYVTMIYDVRNLPKNVAKDLLKELLKTAPVEVNDFLVFTDTALNIRRAMKALEIVDVPGAATRIHIVDLEFATAKDMKARIDEFFAKPSSSGAGAVRPAYRGGFEATTSNEPSASHKIVADDRTNKLIILASDKDYLQIREFIDKLDVRGTSATAQINVYQLQNQKAPDVAKTLQGLLGATTPKTNQPRAVPYGQPAEGSQFEGEIKVQADEKTNTLLISSSRRDFNTVSEVLNKLDRRRPQVFVEAVILEISTSDTEKFGLNFYSAFNLPNINGLGSFTGIAGNAGGQDLATNVLKNLGSNLLSNPGAASALSLGSFIGTLGVMGQSQLTIAGQTVQVPSVGAVLNFLTTFSNVEVIGTPSLMTVDNEQAEIKIGEKRPMSSGVTSVPGAATAAAGIGGIGTLTNNITREEIKTTLKIKPAVKDNDEILMEIEQTVQDLGDPVSIPGAGTLNSVKEKYAKTVVMAADQQTIVIGGLINKSKRHIENKIPFLGDIPVLGYLFKDTEDRIIDSNLLLVLTPYVIRSPADTLKIYERKKKEHEDFGKLYFGDKITRYNPSIDYSKKPGPIAKMLHEYDVEMTKVENGGPGQAGEIVIRAEEPEHKEEVLKGTLPEITTEPSAATPPIYPLAIPPPAEPFVPEPQIIQTPPAAVPPAEGVPTATPPVVTTPAPNPSVTPPATPPTPL